MGKVKIPGLAKSKGMEGFTPWDPGDYTVEVLSVEAKPSDKSAGTSYRQKFTIIDGPDQENGRAVEGKPLNNSIFIMDEEHPSFEQWGSLGVGEFKSFLDACNIKVSSSDSIDPESLVGSQLVVRVKIEVQEGRDPQNRITKYMAVE